ncbi:MAG: hypothetical protein JO062_12855 [Bryobacterales bacterium]|nr:hypothetical protein [Bryobacterales bacterium]
MWRYRVRDYRIICDIRESSRVGFVLAIKHRSIVYNEAYVPARSFAQRSRGGLTTAGVATLMVHSLRHRFLPLGGALFRGK